MNIVLNMGTLRQFGSETIGKNLLRALRAHEGIDRLEAWIPQEWGPRASWQAGAQRGRCEIKQVKAGSVRKLLTENVHLYGALRRGRPDVLFSMGDTGPLRCPVPQLLMVQQAYLAYPRDELGFHVPPRMGVKLRLMDAYFRVGLRSVTRFTVQTENMRQRLSRRWGLDPAAISVVPSAVDDLWASDAAAPVAAAGSDPYICYVATLGPHKNYELLPDVMALLRERFPRLTCHLTVAAGDVPQMISRAKRRGVLDRFVLHGFLGAHEARSLLAGALAVLIPSRLESFGYGYYEALAAGRAVVAADKPFAREACGDAALYADERSAEGFARHVGELVMDVALRARLEARGRQRFAKIGCSWDAVAQRYVELLRECVAATRG